MSHHTAHISTLTHICTFGCWKREEGGEKSNFRKLCNIVNQRAAVSFSEAVTRRLKGYVTFKDLQGRYTAWLQDSSAGQEDCTRWGPSVLQQDINLLNYFRDLILMSHLRRVHFCSLISVKVF